MRRFTPLLLVISLVVNVALSWLVQATRSDVDVARAETERFQGQLAEVSQELRTIRSENGQLRAQLGVSDGPPTAPTLPDTRQANEEQIAALHRIEDQVVRIRGLAAKNDVPIEFLDRDQLREYFQESFDREYSPEEREQDRKLLTFVGLITPGTDLTTIMVDLLQEQVVGFYDDDRKTMALIGDVVELSPDERITYAHEFTHALQDQYFGLKALNPPNPENDDRSLAVQALVEGDATLLMGLWANQNLSPREMQQAASGGSSDRLRDAPLVLRVELLFPYTDGLRFVQRLYEQGGYNAVDNAFRNPPRSTEQIIHPEKFAQGDEPIAVDVPDAATLLGPGWTEVTSSTFGELDLRILVEQFTDRNTATRAASGWGGDRYRLFEDGSGRLVFVLKTAWDTTGDADEFQSAMVQGLRKRFGLSNGRSTPGADTRVAIPAADQPSLVSKVGTEVLVIMGQDETTVNQVATALGH